MFENLINKKIPQEKIDELMDLLAVDEDFEQETVDEVSIILTVRYGTELPEDIASGFSVMEVRTVIKIEDGKVTYTGKPITLKDASDYDFRLIEMKGLRNIMEKEQNPNPFGNMKRLAKREASITIEQIGETGPEVDVPSWGSFYD
jgi:hypothetical protein